MLNDLLTQIDSDLKTGKLIKPETWIDRCFLLSAFLEEEQIREAELEVALAQRVEEIAGTQEKMNMTAAENKSKLTPEYLAYKRQKAKTLKIENYIASSKKHSSRLY